MHQYEDNPGHERAGITSPPSVRLSVKVFVAIMATLATLPMAEWMAGAVRGHAWSYLNIYQVDARYGVRLQSDVETATRSREGRITQVRTNSLGFRGGDWLPASGDAPVPGRILLLGDSQVFGYGVDASSSMAYRLEEKMGGAWHVLNAAVPTWGPTEYVMALEDLGPVYRPQVVVVMANLANDWFEAKAANSRRTTARDGWAAYNLEGQEPITSFPGRRWLYGRSHLFYMLRGLAAQASKTHPVHAVSAQRLVGDLRHLLMKDGEYRSRLTRHILAIRSRCEVLGCRVVVAGLPLDVQVHDGEWQKYDTSPLRNAAFERTRSLMHILLSELRSHGQSAVDLLPPLRAGSPGAFLPDDYHLSPQGHAIIAEVLSAVIRGDIDTHRVAQPTTMSISTEGRL